jgi:hypothetical protein
VEDLSAEASSVEEFVYELNPYPLKKMNYVRYSEGTRYYAGQKIFAVIVCQLKKKKIVIRTLLSS